MMFLYNVVPSECIVISFDGAMLIPDNRGIIISAKLCINDGINNDPDNQAYR